MKLQSKHIRLLTPLEQKVYRSLLTSIDTDRERRDLFVSKSHKYHEGDENVLPFPERSHKGVMLFSLCRSLKLKDNDAAVVLEPKVPSYAAYIKQKLLSLGTEMVYAIPPTQLFAAIYGKGRNPFTYYRDKSEFSLPGINFSDDKRVLCAINPPSQHVSESPEYNVLGILLKNINSMDPNNLPLFSEAAKLGLTEVAELSDKRLWVYGEQLGDNS